MKRYKSLNGLRAFAAIGIVLMHVRANIDVVVIGNFIYERIIPLLSDLVFLFMMVSAFSLCCGYYDRFKNGTISLNEFYKKRYLRLLPFFVILVFVSVIIPHAPNKAAAARIATAYGGSSGLSSFVEKAIEGLSEMTLGYGLLPNPTMSVMGVGWFLGVIFLFYMLFPFFVFMIDNKKRAWLSFAIVNILCFFCISYFFGPKFISFEAIPKSFLYNTPFFLAGGLLFLYRERIEHYLSLGGGRKWVLLLLCMGLTVAYWICDKWTSMYTYSGVLIITVTMAAWLIYTIGCPNKVMHNRVIDYLSGISMEIYLSHMMSFRAVQFLHISHYIHNTHLVYIITCSLTLVVAICFSHLVKYKFLPWTRNLSCIVVRNK